MKKCELAKTCPGCSLWDVDYAAQLEQKKHRLLELFPILQNKKVNCYSAAEHGLRQRFDFIIKDNVLGLIDKNKNFVVINRCLQLTDNLQSALDLVARIFKESSLHIKLGTLRLRESSRGQQSQFGLWLDFANADIKKLLLEKKTLIKLSEYFFVEVGQKKKCLDRSTFESEQIKLASANIQYWFHTYNYKTKQTIDLNCAVSSFTQPSAVSAKLITDIFTNWLNDKPENIWEFGCGIGQYTLPMLSLGHHVDVFENDELAIACVKKTAQTHGLDQNLLVHTGDFQKVQNLNTTTCPGVIVVNPPKSGLKGFANNVVNSSPKNIIYISCYPDTLKADSEVFLKHNYTIQQAHIVDQFPQTSHYEVVMLFERVNI